MIWHFKRLCIFRPKGAIQIRYYYFSQLTLWQPEYTLCLKKLHFLLSAITCSNVYWFLEFLAQWHLNKCPTVWGMYCPPRSVCSYTTLVNMNRHISTCLTTGLSSTKLLLFSIRTVHTCMIFTLTMWTTAFVASVARFVVRLKNSEVGMMPNCNMYF